MGKVELTPSAGFEWRKVTWGRADSQVSALCSYCSASIRDHEIPLRLWTKSHAAQFCEKCQRKWWGMR